MIFQHILQLLYFISLNRRFRFPYGIIIGVNVAVHVAVHIAVVAILYVLG